MSNANSSPQVPAFDHAGLRVVANVLWPAPLVFWVITSIFPRPFPGQEALEVGLVLGMLVSLGAYYLHLMLYRFHFSLAGFVLFILVLAALTLFTGRQAGWVAALTAGLGWSVIFGFGYTWSASVCCFLKIRSLICKRALVLLGLMTPGAAGLVNFWMSYQGWTGAIGWSAFGVALILLGAMLFLTWRARRAAHLSAQSVVFP